MSWAATALGMYPSSRSPISVLTAEQSSSSRIVLAHLRARRARGQRSPARPRLAPRAQPLRVAQLEEEERRAIS